MDRDGDGIVTKTEFTEWHIKRRGAPPSEEELQKFYEADEDEDGTMTQAEFQRCASLLKTTGGKVDSPGGF